MDASVIFYVQPVEQLQIALQRQDAPSPIKETKVYTARAQMPAATRLPPTNGVQAVSRAACPSAGAVMRHNGVMSRLVAAKKVAESRSPPPPSKATGSSRLQYSVSGRAAAVSLVNRLATPGVPHLGELSPLTPVTLPDEIKIAAQIPIEANMFAFAYPLECLEEDASTLLERVVGSAVRLDDDLFFFLLLGGFCYFQQVGESVVFLQANAISLKPSKGSIWFDGPYAVTKASVDALRTQDRLRPVTLPVLHSIKCESFAWVNPGEQLEGYGLSDDPALDWGNGAFVYSTSSGEDFFFAVAVTPDVPPSRTAKRIKGSHGDISGSFNEMHATFEKAEHSSEKLKYDLWYASLTPVERWMRSSGLVIGVYYGLGMLLYDYLEGWSYFDTAYFLTTTATTVGYGDFCPGTEMGRLVTTLYAPLGTVAVMSGLLPIVEWVLEEVDSLMGYVVYAYEKVWRACRWCMITAKQRRREALSGPGQKVKIIGLGQAIEVRAETAVLHALSSPVLIMVVGVILSIYIHEYTSIDAFYWTMITMTTIGYGDLLPENVPEKLYTIVLMLIGTTALAATVGRYEKLSVASRIYETNFSLKLNELLLEDSLDAVSYQPSLTETEFVVRTLVDFDIVDAATIDEIRSRFRELIKIDKGKAPAGEAGGEVGCATIRTLYKYLVAQGRVLDSNRVGESHRIGRREQSAPPRGRHARPGPAGALAAAPASSNGRYAKLESSKPNVQATSKPSTRRAKGRRSSLAEIFVGKDAASGQAIQSHASGERETRRGNARRASLLAGPLEKMSEGSVVVNMAVPDRGFSEWFEGAWKPAVESHVHSKAEADGVPIGELAGGHLPGSMEA